MSHIIWCDIYVLLCETLNMSQISTNKNFTCKITCNSFFYVKLHVIVLVKLPTLLALPPPKEVVAAIFWWWPEISTIPLVINDFPVEVAWFSRKNIKFRWRLRDSTENIKVPMQQHKENIQTTIRFFFREIEFDWFRRRSSSRRFSRVEINEKEKNKRFWWAQWWL